MSVIHNRPDPDHVASQLVKSAELHLLQPTSAMDRQRMERMKQMMGSPSRTSPTGGPRPTTAPASQYLAHIQHSTAQILRPSSEQCARPSNSLAEPAMQPVLLPPPSRTSLVSAGRSSPRSSGGAHNSPARRPSMASTQGSTNSFTIYHAWVDVKRAHTDQAQQGQEDTPRRTSSPSGGGAGEGGALGAGISTSPPQHSLFPPPQPRPHYMSPIPRTIHSASPMPHPPPPPPIVVRGSRQALTSELKTLAQASGRPLEALQPIQRPISAPMGWTGAATLWKDAEDMTLEEAGMTYEDVRGRGGRASVCACACACAQAKTTGCGAKCCSQGLGPVTREWRGWVCAVLLSRSSCLQMPDSMPACSLVCSLVQAQLEPLSKTNLGSGF